MRKLLFILSVAIFCCGTDKIELSESLEFFSWYFYFLAAQKLRIPNRFINCYRGNLTESWNPQTLSFVIEIIRKIENSRPTSLDLRHLSARLFHELAKIHKKILLI
jgi:hypothetical protein